MTEIQNQKLKSAIMQRVYFIYFARKIANLATLEILATGLFLAIISPFFPYVSLGNIFTNMPAPTNFKMIFVFIESAIMNTEFIVQISLLAFLSALVAYVASLAIKPKNFSPRFN